MSERSTVQRIGDVEQMVTSFRRTFGRRTRPTRRSPPTRPLPCVADSSQSGSCSEACREPRAETGYAGHYACGDGFISCWSRLRDPRWFDRAWGDHSGEMAGSSRPTRAVQTQERRGSAELAELDPRPKHEPAESDRHDQQHDEDRPEPAESVDPASLIPIRSKLLDREVGNGRDADPEHKRGENPKAVRMSQG
jgi:hypothetical protein